MVLSGLHFARSLADDLDLHARSGESGLDLVVQAEGQSQGVETRPEVRRGRGHTHHDRSAVGHRHLQIERTRCRNRRADDQASSRAVAAAWASTGIVPGAGAPEIAQSGSLRPLPVTVHTTRSPASISPCSRAWSRPATLAAEASSTNTPSS